MKGFAIGGICLIRLKKIRPSFLPLPWGIGSENAAHRIAVEWDVKGVTKQGVYVPRRDTDSCLNTLAGGRLFPGVQHHAKFTNIEEGDNYSVEMRSSDGIAHVLVSGKVTEGLPAESVFDSLKEVSDFFENGSLGYSATNKEGVFDGLELCSENWSVQSFAVDEMRSSYFDDEARFPKGTVVFDNALLMRGIEHQWLGREDLCCNEVKAR